MRFLFITIGIAILILVSCPENNSSSNNAGQDSPTSSLNYTTIVGTLVYVPAGSFQRDSTSTNISQVSAFRISEKEITQRQFNAIVGTMPSQNNSGDDNPVETVNWYHALVFCNKLSQAENLTPVYSINGSTDSADWGSVPTTSDATWNAAVPNWAANGYRLPTQMEWMWAAMGATNGSGYSGSGVYTTGYSKAFAGSTGSNNIDGYVWCFGNSANMTYPVGTKLPNELGLFDMSGNVWEWCWDWSGTPSPGTLTDYTGPSTGANRVKMGWSGFEDCKVINITSTIAVSPKYSGAFVGFRVVRL